MTRQERGSWDPDWLRQGKPANTATLAESIPRLLAGGDLAIAATGVELAVGIPLVPGDLVTGITFVTGGTAAGTPTAGYAVLRDPTGAKLAQTADFGSTARAANTAYRVTLATAYQITDPGFYIIGISFTASTIPTLRGISVGNAVLSGALGLSLGVLSQSHGSAVGATAPATIATPTNSASVPLLIVN